MPTRQAAWIAARWLGVATLWLLLAAGLSACDPVDPSSATGDSTGDADPSGESAGPSIVSLTPAVTRMLIDMGMRDRLVGVSREDDAGLGLPVCGSYKQPVVAKILELEPDLVITESAAGDRSDVPAMLVALADQGLFKLVVIPHSRSIADVERALTDAAAGLGQAVGDTGSAERARRLMATRLELVQSAIAGTDKPRVLMLIEPSTLGALGPGATHDEMLRMAGGANAIAELKSDYLKLTRPQVQLTARPDVVLIFEPNGRPLQPNDTRLRALEGLDVPAVTLRRFAVIDHPSAMLPSTDLPAVVAQMAKAIHPDRAEAIDKAYALAERVMQQQGDEADAVPGGGP